MGKGRVSNARVAAGARWSSTDLAVAGAIAVVAAAVRANAVYGGLVWDDHLIVAAISREGGFSVDMLLRPALDVPGFRGRFYHPLQLLLYGIGWSIGAKQPQAYHALLVALHALVAGAMTLYAAALFRATKGPIAAAWWAGLAFAVLPIHTQAVAWVISCTDVICAAFLIAAAIAGLASRDLVCAAGTAVGLLGALGAKETALPAVVFLPIQAALLSAPPVRRRRVAVVCIACALAVIVYLVLRASSGFSIFAPLSATELESLQGSLQKLLPTTGWYALRLMVPIVPMEELLTVPRGTIPFALGLLSALGLVFIAAYAWRRNDRVALIACAWLALFLAPALTPPAMVGQPFGLHRLYIPSIGWIILLADGAARAVAQWNHVRMLSTIGVAGLAVLAIRSWQGNRLWRDDESFWTAMVQANPGHAMPLSYLAEAYLRAGNVAAAMQQFTAAAQGDGSAADRARPLEMSATVLQSQGNLDGACDLLDRAFVLIPEEPRTRRNAAACRAAQAVNAARSGGNAAPRLLEARARLEALVRDMPNDASIHRLLGEVLLALGDLAGGRQALERTVALSPDTDDGRQAAAALRRVPRQ